MANSDGWWDVPAAEVWLCPNCRMWSDADTWMDTFVGCEDCGDHEARICPNCDERFDHVWGARDIAIAMAEAANGK